MRDEQDFESVPRKRSTDACQGFDGPESSEFTIPLWPVALRPS